MYAILLQLVRARSGLYWAAIMRSPQGRIGNELTRSCVANARRSPRRVSLKSRARGWSFATIDYTSRSVEYVVCGTLLLREGGREIRIGEGMTVLTFPGCAYELATAQQTCEAVVVHNASMRAEPMNPICVVLPRHPDLALLAAAARRAMSARGRFQLDVALTAGDHLAARAYEVAEGPLAQPQSGIEDWLALAQRLLEAESDTDRTLQGIVGGVPVPYPRLLRLLAARLGMTVREYRSARRVEIAKGVLVTSCDAITSVAHQLGYSASQHFATEFRRIAGATPSAFRTRARDRR